MKLSTGKIAFPLQFDNGDVENIFINPHEEGLQERIKNFESSIKKRIENIKFDKYKDAFEEGVDVSNLDFSKLIEMTPEELDKVTKQTDAITEIDKEVEREICAELDDIFKSDISSKAFKYVPPLAMVQVDENGEEFELYLLLVIKALAAEVQKYGEKMNAATNKYTAKYQKK